MHSCFSLRRFYVLRWTIPCFTTDLYWTANKLVLNVHSNCRHINQVAFFLQEKQRRLIGAPSGGKIVHISEKYRHLVQVFSLLNASSCRFITSFFGSVLYQAHCFEEND